MKKFFLFVVLSIFAASCEIVSAPGFDSEGGNGGPQPPAEIPIPTTVPTDSAQFASFLFADSVLSANWEAIEFTIDLRVFGEVSLDCRLDDVIQLNADGTYSFDGGTLLCEADGTDPFDDNIGSREGTFTFDVATSTLSFELDGNTFEGTIDGLSQNRLVIEGAYDDQAIRGVYALVEE